MMRKVLTILAFFGFAPLANAGDGAVWLPYFGAAPWGDWSRNQPMQWTGEYARLTSGYSFTSFRKAASIGGPTIGVEAGKSWREGNWVYGASLDADYRHSSVYRFSGTSALPIWARDAAASARIKSGYLIRPDLLVYGSVGVTGINYNLHRPTTLGSKQSEFILHPDMRAGAIWAVNDKTTITLEVGVRPPLR